MTINLFLTVVVPYLILFFILFVGIPVVIFGLVRFTYEALTTMKMKPKPARVTMPLHRGQHA